MPIIDPPANSPQLLQGDILQGVALYATARSWGDDGGEPARRKASLCLVLSRPCATIHKPKVVVAEVGRYADNAPKKIESFKEVVYFLRGMRDGWGAPDIFYLGQLPGRDGRFCARFDAIFTIEVPSDPADLADFVKGARIGSLNNEFVRDLHLRVFGAFASLGFSDQGWLSDADLKWVVEKGREDLLAARAKLQGEKGRKANQEARGARFDEKALRGSEMKVAELTEELQPYIEEWESRGLGDIDNQDDSEGDLPGYSVPT